MELNRVTTGRTLAVTADNHHPDSGRPDSAKSLSLHGFFFFFFYQNTSNSWSQSPPPVALRPLHPHSSPCSRCWGPRGPGWVWAWRSDGWNHERSRRCGVELDERQSPQKSWERSHGSAVCFHAEDLMLDYATAETFRANGRSLENTLRNSFHPRHVPSSYFYFIYIFYSCLCSSLQPKCCKDTTLVLTHRIETSVAGTHK